jgi:hypothetical protein
VTRAFWWCVWLVVRAYAFTRPRRYLEGANVTRWFLTSRPTTDKTGTPGWYLHRFHGPDKDRRTHNHPWSRATTRILRGGYVELREYDDGARLIFERRPGDCVEIFERTFHRVAALHGETWTLFHAGPKHGRGWGFKKGTP